MFIKYQIESFSPFLWVTRSQQLNETTLVVQGKRKSKDHQLVKGQATSQIHRWLKLFEGPVNPLLLQLHVLDSALVFLGVNCSKHMTAFFSQENNRHGT